MVVQKINGGGNHVKQKKLNSGQLIEHIFSHTKTLNLKVYVHIYCRVMQCGTHQLSVGKGDGLCA